MNVTTWKWQMQPRGRRIPDLCMPAGWVKVPFWELEDKSFFIKYLMALTSLIRAHVTLPRFRSLMLRMRGR